jgi:hypothetical protein
VSVPLDDAFADLQEQLEHDAAPWQHRERPELLGRCRARARRTSQHSENYPVLTIETREGDWVDVHAFHTVLWQEVEQQDPQPGDVVGIKYLGRRTGGQSRDGYEAFKLAVVRQSSSGVGDPAVTGSAHMDPRQDGTDLPPREPVRHDDDEGGGLGAGPSLGAGAVTTTDPHTRIELWAELVMRCERTGMDAAGVLNTAIEGARFTRTSAPASATVDELQRAIAWLVSSGR